MKIKFIFLMLIFVAGPLYSMEQFDIEQFPGSAREDDWEYYKESYIAQVKDATDFAIELKRTEDVLQVVPKHGLDNWTDDHSDESVVQTCTSCCGYCTGVAFCCGGASLIVSSIILTTHLLQKNSAVISDVEVFSGSAVFFALCMAPVVLRRCLFFRKDMRARGLTQSMANIPSAHPLLFSHIKHQRADEVITLLKGQCKIKLPLDIMTDRFGRTPLLAAIDQANLAKDPDVKIIQELIAQGASLWYETIYRKKNPSQMEAGEQTPLLLEEQKPRGYDQPFLMLLNKKVLYNSVLKPLCGLAQETLLKKKEGTQDEGLVRYTLAGTYPSEQINSGKQEE